ncbi:unnamed protein product [Callosobruchus maculatus]|uniref:Uncharacterized protein n=1 Tax=Callosobruchus maculatus TaxID=64391 RepID=A0A653BNT4_CALMS|nr:unnamed protein product [Callosobruchus maculatus]
MFFQMCHHSLGCHVRGKTEAFTEEEREDGGSYIGLMDTFFKQNGLTGVLSARTATTASGVWGGRASSASSASCWCTRNATKR